MLGNPQLTGASAMTLPLPPLPPQAAPSIVNAKELGLTMA